mmetsp:Transcript_17175/g.42465  ORF Transcript_17175/g.42465 Transcript_17175/m.42465 type:complete len:338 (-) Transcript_17175:579-1592(-)
MHSPSCRRRRRPRHRPDAAQSNFGHLPPLDVHLYRALVRLGLHRLEDPVDERRAKRGNYAARILTGEHGKVPGSDVECAYGVKVHVVMHVLRAGVAKLHGLQRGLALADDHGCQDVHGSGGGSCRQTLGIEHHRAPLQLQPHAAPVLHRQQRRERVVAHVLVAVQHAHWLPLARREDPRTWRHLHHALLHDEALVRVHLPAGLSQVHPIFHLHLHLVAQKDLPVQGKRARVAHLEVHCRGLGALHGDAQAGGHPAERRQRTLRNETAVGSPPALQPALHGTGRLRQLAVERAYGQLPPQHGLGHTIARNVGDAQRGVVGSGGHSDVGGWFCPLSQGP